MVKTKFKVLLNHISNFLTSYTKANFTNFMRVRTGRLRNSIAAIVEDDKVLFGAGVVYARIQELGGKIRPVRARRLWIPTQFNKTPAGVIRYKPRDIFNEGFIRNDTFYWVNDKKIIPMFNLRHETNIRSKKFMENSIKVLNERITEIVDKFERGENIFGKILEEVKNVKKGWRWKLHNFESFRV